MVRQAMSSWACRRITMTLSFVTLINNIVILSLSKGDWHRHGSTSSPWQLGHHDNWGHHDNPLVTLINNIVTLSLACPELVEGKGELIACPELVEGKGELTACLSLSKGSQRNLPRHGSTSSPWQIFCHPELVEGSPWQHFCNPDKLTLSPWA